MIWMHHEFYLQVIVLSFIAKWGYDIMGHHQKLGYVFESFCHERIGHKNSEICFASV